VRPKPECETCPVRTHGVFCDLTKEELREVVRGRTPNTYRKHSIIFYEGNPSMGLFGVWSGKVKVSNHGVNGHLQIARLAKPGDILGYRALLADEPYAATAEVLEDAVICFLDKNVFFQILKRNPNLMLRIMKKVCQELRVAERHALDLVQKPVVQRVASLLLDLERDFGEPTPAGIRLDIELTREEMAQMVGTTAESLIRTLSEFKAKGCVDMAGHQVLVRNHAELAKMVPQET
jgi:CRP/FNR family transcriptional regulator, polysaccharide utilization system transcription regulator